MNTSDNRSSQKQRIDPSAVAERISALLKAGLEQEPQVVALSPGLAAILTSFLDAAGPMIAAAAERDQLAAERDDLLQHRAASEAPGWTYQGPYSEGAHLSDAVVACRVRMLTRYDLDHEAVCCLARDRIRDLSREVARLRALLPGEAA